MKVLIFYAAYGGGHFSAANAIKETIEKEYQNVQIEVIDCMEYLNKVVNYLTVKSYEEMTKKTPKLWGKVYKASRKGIVAAISNSSNKIFASKLGRLIQSKKPDIIISAHPFSTQMCAILKKKGKLNVKVSTVLTDFKYHEQWLVKHEYLEEFFCSNEKMRQDLITYGIDKEKVFCTGMPISYRFLEDFNREEILKEFNLKDNLKTILFFAGGKMGLARKNIFEYMKCLANNFDGIQIVAISGKNKKIYDKFKEIAKGHENVKVLEFTNKVPELMHVSELVITKPGGITSSEALASELPILAINPIPGQEEENAEFLEEVGSARWLKKGEDFEEVINEILKDERLNILKNNIKKVSKVNSASEICRIIFGK